MIEVDEGAVCANLRAVVDDARFRHAIANLTGDPLLLSLFLMGVGYGEGLAEAGLAAIGQDEIATLLPREHRRVERARVLVQELFPEFFDHGQYRYEDNVPGRDQYFAVREANRRRLRERGRYSALNLHLTTTFGYDVMLQLLGDAVSEALDRSPLPPAVTERVASVVGPLLAARDAEGGVVGQHNALLGVPRADLSPSAVDALELLARLTAADYEWAADLAARELVASYLPYADATAVRRRVLGA